MTQLTSTQPLSSICESLNDDKISPSILPRCESSIPSSSHTRLRSLQTPQKSSRVLRSRTLLPKEPSFTDCISDTNSAEISSNPPRAPYINRSSTPIYRTSSPRLKLKIKSVQKNVKYAI